MAIAFAGPLSGWFGADAADADRLRSGVLRWRDELRAAVAPKVAEQLDWDEGGAAHATSDLGAAGWPALRLFALLAERTDLELPDTVPNPLELDREWRAASDAGFERSRYGHLLACSVWLPGDFPVTLRAPMPDGTTAEFGSLTVLRDQMRWLNERTFAADAAAVAGWRDLAAPPDGALLDAARRGYAALWHASTNATEWHAPLVVANARPRSPGKRA